GWMALAYVRTKAPDWESPAMKTRWTCKPCSGLSGGGTLNHAAVCERISHINPFSVWGEDSGGNPPRGSGSSDCAQVACGANGFGISSPAYRCASNSLSDWIATGLTVTPT